MQQAPTARREDQRTVKTVECTKCGFEMDCKKGENFEGHPHTGCGGEFQ